MNIRYKILGSYVLILFIGVAISAQIFFSGQAIDQTTDHLLRKNVPLLAAISQIKNSVTEFERSHYEYFITPDQQRMQRQHQLAEQRLGQTLQRLDAEFPGSAQLQKIHLHTQEIYRLTHRLHRALPATRDDWKIARGLLMQISEQSRQIHPLLDNLKQKLQSEVFSTANLVRSNTSQATKLVLAFSVLILLVAALVAYYMDRYISVAADRKRLASYPHRSPDPVLSIDHDGTVSYLNLAAKALLTKMGLPDDLPQGLFPENFTTIHHHLLQSERELFEWVYPLQGLLIKGLLHRLNDLSMSHLHLQDISNQDKDRRELQFLAYNDALTRLPNRQQFERAASKLGQPKESDNPAMAVGLIKLDRFNLITAGHGYSDGDAIIAGAALKLVYACDQIAAHCRQIYRFDGATFGIIISAATVDNFFANLSDILTRPLIINGAEFYITMSIGYSVFPDDDNDGMSLIKNADACVSRAIAEGGDRLRRFTPELRSQEQSWLATERALRQGLDKNELRLYYQPQLDANSGRLNGMEALIRWQRADKTMVLPIKFIPIAEQTGLIVRIGEWVIREACMQATRWQQQYNQRCIVAINISPKQFLHHDFLFMVKRILQETCVDPHLIEFEITEGVMVDNTEHCIDILEGLKAMGLWLSIDDFGTGYSSMSYLKRFNIDKLKIDQAFIRHLTDDSKDLAIVRTIIELSHNLDLKVIAEGVETHEQRQLLQRYHCEELQGYLIGRPKPAAELGEFFLAS